MTVFIFSTFACAPLDLHDFVGATVIDTDFDYL